MKNIVVHSPRFVVEEIEKTMSKRDGVKIRYVCTTELPGYRGLNDIFYRRSPHPKFGNKYFGMYQDDGKSFIFDADIIEDLSFGMIEHGGKMYYSAYRHDYVSKGKKVIDGGRDYIRGSGFKIHVVKNGNFKEK